MTYATFEEGAETSRPVELFEFQVGTTAYRYTSADTDRTVDLLTYEAIAIGRGPSAIGPDERENQFEIEMPADNPFAGLWKSSVPGERASVKVSRYQYPDGATPEVIRVFEGFVETVNFTDDVRLAIISCRSAIGAMSRPIPRFTCQGSCNHMLYDDFCKVSNADPAFRASSETPSGQSGRTLTVPGLGATYVDGWFDGGMVEVAGGSDYRLVISHTGDDLELLLPFPTVPGTVNVFAGCAHDIATCKSKFDNVVNYGGFAFVPTKNIFETGLN